MPVALITGAGSGIGRAIALRLNELAHALALVGRTASTLQAVAREIHQAGGSSLVLAADVSNPEAVEQSVQQTVARFGRIDVLVNCAGVAPMLPLAQVTPEQWRQVLDTNLSAAFYTTRAVWPILQRQHRAALAQPAAAQPARPTGGAIINISSAAARDPFPGFGAYAAAKAGLNMLSRVTAREGEADGIRVLCVAPAGVETPMFRALPLPQDIPTESLLQPADVAELVADFLTGALRHASGETLYIHRQL